MPPEITQPEATSVRVSSSVTSQTAMEVTKIATGSRRTTSRTMPPMSPRITPDSSEPMTTSSISQAAMTTAPGRPGARPGPAEVHGVNQGAVRLGWCRLVLQGAEELGAGAGRGVGDPAGHVLDRLVPDPARHRPRRIGDAGRGVELDLEHVRVVAGLGVVAGSGARGRARCGPRLDHERRRQAGAEDGEGDGSQQQPAAEVAVSSSPGWAGPQREPSRRRGWRCAGAASPAPR